MASAINVNTRVEFAPGMLPRAEPCVIAIYGATGDLTRRKLVPALFHLACAGTMARQFRVVGIGRRALSDDEFRDQLKQDVQRSPESGRFTEEDWRGFASRLSYLQGDFTEEQTHARLADRLNALAPPAGGNRLYYLATPPSAAPDIIRGLEAAELLRQDRSWSRVLLEKPFGRDLASAQALNATVAQVFDEHQVYRIDHYPGKETVQNILFFPFR